MKTTQQHSLTELTQAVTAFGTWNELAAAMDNGYTPTLRVLPGRSKAQAARNAMVVELADRLEILGWKVWRGTNG